jgi:hypothetical protein
LREAELKKKNAEADLKNAKPEEKKEIKMLDANDLDNLIDLLHNEAKVL